MAQRSRVLCKYFMHGACYKGDSCEFSHNWDDPLSSVCVYYQRGYCSYGAKCRYEHVKMHNPKLAQAMARVLKGATTASLADSSQGTSAGGNSTTLARKTGASSIAKGGKGSLSFAQVSAASSAPVHVRSSMSGKQLGPPAAATSFQGESSRDLLSDSSSPSSRWILLPEALDEDPFSIEQQMEVARLLDDDDPADEPICSLGITGQCVQRSPCTHLHGDLCPICQKNCLHPLRPEEREEHLRVCAQIRKRVEATLISQDIECVVCLERVLSKQNPAERKFGILSECDHPFCISCLRSWRNGFHPPGMDIKTIIRGCPVCRVISHYVIPSQVWFSTPKEKEEIISGYKKKLSSLDCRHFDQGNGTCPFGTSCFYKHAYKDGRLEEIKLRHLGTADGNGVIAKNIRLSDFIGKFDSHARSG